MVLVQNGRGHSLALLDATSGRALGPALGIGGIPWQAAAVPGGVLVIVRGATQAQARLLAVTAASPAPSGGASGGVGGGWTVRPVPLEAGAVPSVLASDGARFAAVAYGMPGRVTLGPACRAAVIDLLSYATVSVGDFCAHGEEVTALALLPVAAAERVPTVLVGSVRRAAPGGAERPGAVTRMNGETGTRGLRIALDGEPQALAPVRLEDATHVLCVVAPPHDETGSSRRVSSVMGLHSLTLDTEYEISLPGGVYGLAAASDEASAYAVVGTGPRLPASVLRLDVTSGSAGRVASLPSGGLGLAVTADRLLIPAPDGDVVWVIRRSTGQVLRGARVGAGPIGVTAIGR